MSPRSIVPQTVIFQWFFIQFVQSLSSVKSVASTPRSKTRPQISKSQGGVLQGLSGNGLLKEPFLQPSLTMISLRNQNTIEE